MAKKKVSPTVHNNIVNKLTEIVEKMESLPDFTLPAIFDAALPVIKQIRKEQRYDQEILDLVDRIETLGSKPDENSIH